MGFNPKHIQWKSGKCFFWVTLLLLLSPKVTAQVDSLSNDIDQVIEDAISNSGIDEQVDFSFLTDALEDLQKNPLNLNTATREELLIIPGMNDLLVNNLFTHIEEFGVLTTIYELQAIAGFTQEVTSQLLPYVSVKENTAKDISPGSLHPAGPGFQEVWKGLKIELTQRAVFIAEEQKGYTSPDTTFRSQFDDNGIMTGTDTSLSSRYVGSPVQLYTRLRARYNQNFSFGITAEKDRGEEFRWDPSTQYFGYDYTSAHISLKDYGNLKNLVVGDYTLQFGQGLIFSRGLGFGKGAETINSVKMPGQGIRPYSSVNENQFLRGAAVTYAIDRFYLTAFGSRVQLDASIQERDTLTEQVELVGSIQTSGLHRTRSELNNRKAISETAIGGRLEYRTRTLRIGTSHYLQQFDSEINRPFNDYNQFDFRGDQNFLSGIDVDWVYQNFNFFGEMARSKSGGIGATVGFLSSLSKTLDLAVVARSFDKDFHTTKGYAFAERPTAIQNEKGLYIGIKIKPNDKWTLSGYFDQFFFPWNKFGASYPSRGYEYLGQVEFKPRRGTTVYLRFRSDNK
ncbi:helix-hairpin-helix domain-containing protein, partial [bacterium]|nr:helix-hairpin-helix domain-containing protein [bacterium]